MNEVEELSKLEVQNLPPLGPIVLDDLHHKVLKNLHLELGSGPALYLLSPSYSVLPHTPTDLTTHYEDKIYIGRDFMDLFNLKRKHFGVKEMALSLRDQDEKMIDKAQEKLASPLEYKSFFQEIKELVTELISETELILQSLAPP